MRGRDAGEPTRRPKPRAGGACRERGGLDACARATFGGIVSGRAKPLLTIASLIATPSDVSRYARVRPYRSVVTTSKVILCSSPRGASRSSAARVCRPTGA